MMIDLNARIDFLKSLHLIMMHMNNEGAYLEWIEVGVPDCPNEDDYEYIAQDDVSFNDCINEFERITQEYISDGLCY